MPDLLNSLGLAPAPTDDAAAAAAVAEPVPPVAPEVPAVPEVPTVVDPDETIVIPEGAENPDAVRNAIRAERKKAADANARARELERELAARAEAEKPLEQRVTEAEAEAKTARLGELRITIAAKHNILDFASRLQGETAEAIEADAQSLLSSLTTVPAQPGLTLGGGPAPLPVVKKDPQAEHNAFIGDLLSGRTQS